MPILCLFRDSDTALTVSTEFPASCTPAEYESGNWAMCPVLPGNFEVRSAIHQGKRPTREDDSNPTCSTIIWRIFRVLPAWERLHTILQPMVWSNAFIDSWKMRLDVMPLNVGLRCTINPLGLTSSLAKGLRHILLKGSMANHSSFWDISSPEDQLLFIQADRPYDGPPAALLQTSASDTCHGERTPFPFKDLSTSEHRYIERALEPSYTEPYPASSSAEPMVQIRGFDVKVSLDIISSQPISSLMMNTSLDPPIVCHQPLTYCDISLLGYTCPLYSSVHKVFSWLGLGVKPNQWQGNTMWCEQTSKRRHENNKPKLTIYLIYILLWYLK